MIRALLIAVLMLSSHHAHARPPEPSAVTEHLDTMRLTLTDSKPYRFVLHYRGPTVPFRGELCYGFAGYNETCTRPRLEWLTPATDIELWAPGGVPRDLLLGYVMLVRFPALSTRTYSFRLMAPDQHPRSG